MTAFEIGRTLRHFWSFFGYLLVTLCLLVGCETNRMKQMRQVSQDLDAAKTKSDDLRNAMRYLAQVTPLNRAAMSKEVQLYLNKWLQTQTMPSPTAESKALVDGLPPDLRSAVGLDQLAGKEFTPADIEYLYQCRMFQQLSRWIVAAPVRDSLLRPYLDKFAKEAPQEQHEQLEQACKLFDWSIRNVALQGNATDVEQLLDDVRKPLNDNGIGYGYLPWESVLFSRGDFIERGRVFVALAKQRGLATTWLSLRLPSSPTPKIWAIGVLIGDKCFVFEPKLSLPILNPDTLELSSLEEIQKEPRILRRCDVPGKFDYAVNPGDAANVEFLLDVEPAALAPRTIQLEKALLAEERMQLATDAESVQSRIRKLFPTAPIALWQTPLLAQIYAQAVRERLQMNSPFTMQYMAEHAVWFNETPASTARLKHLRGEFENSFDSQGALSTYMECRLPDEQLDSLPDDPDVQKELGLARTLGEELPQFQMRLRLMQQVLGRAKLDANFLLGQLQFDLGDYESAEGWLKKRTLGDNRAAMWFPAAWYTLARTYQEEGKIEQATSALSEVPSPSEAGNRLRIRYLTRDSSSGSGPN